MQVAIEDEQKLTEYVSRVNAGEPIVLTHNGRPVARIVPEGAATSEIAPGAADRLLALLEKGYDLGGVRVDRDELYDRGR